MRRVLHTIRLCTLALSLALCSCTGVKRELQNVDCLLFSNPDSALVAIGQIDTSCLHTKALRAKYSLLQTMAIDRTGIDTTDYRLLADAVRYYKSRGSVEDRSRTAFYQGRLLFNNHEYNKALQSFLAALQLAEGFDNDWLKGMICTYIAMTYNENHNSSDELKFHSKAYDYFVQTGDSLYIESSVFYLALASHNNRLLDQSDSLLSTIPSSSRQYPFALLYFADNELFRQHPDPERAVRFFALAKDFNAPFTLDMWYQYAYALLLNGNTVECEQMLSRLIKYPKDAKSCWWMFKIAEEKGNLNQALDNLKEYCDKSDAYIKDMLTQSSYKAESEYYSTLSEQAELKRSKAKLISIISILVAVLIVLSIILTNQRRIMNLHGKMEELQKSYYNAQEIATLLKQEIDENKSQEYKISELRSSYVSMYRQQFASIGSLYKKSLPHSVMPEKVELYVEEIMSEIESGDKIEARLNRDLDDIMRKIRDDFPDFSPNTYQFLAYVVAGLKNTSIAEIMGESTTAISTRKSRLKQLILNADTQNHSFYELFLG